MPVSWVADEPTQHIFWNTDDVKALIANSDDLEVAFNALIARGLSRHLLFVTEKAL